MAHLCHLHVININRQGLCVPAPREYHITQQTTFQALKMKPGLLSYCQTFLIYTLSHILALSYDSLFHFPVHQIRTPVIIPHLFFNFTINTFLKIKYSEQNINNAA